MTFDVIETLRRQGLLTDCANPTVTPMAGGFWNDLFRVRGVGFDWVVKHSRTGRGESLFPILPDAEASALRTLRGAGIAPEPVAFFRAGGGVPVLVYQYWPGTPWREGVLPVADLLRRLHAVPAEDLQGFRPLPVGPEEVLAQGDGLLRAIPHDGLAARLRSLRPTPVQGPALRRFSLVHTDVGAGNLIVDAGGIRLIDWQCPGIGDPAEDAWAFLSPAFQILFNHAPLTRDERETFVQAYGEEGTMARLALLSPCFAYRMAAYCCLRRCDLEGRDPALSDRYRRAALAQIAEVEKDLA
ncbi:MAG: aminoglycoside phosphotransferase family protein [Candidatus Latescibacteria bacterium]|nr:aminoglycoside phosphotransferase family protein [Candidatus Latescibacterota bacterium]